MRQPWRMMREGRCVTSGIGDWCLELGFSCLRHGQHLGGKIQADGFRAALGQRQGKIARAAADIERAGARLRAGQLDDAPLPVAVQAEALKVIEPIVTRGDAAEESVYLCGALLAWLEENVGHNGTGGDASRKCALQTFEAPGRNRLRAFVKIEHFNGNEIVVADFLQSVGDGLEVHLAKTRPF